MILFTRTIITFPEIHHCPPVQTSHWSYIISLHMFLPFTFLGRNLNGFPPFISPFLRLGQLQLFLPNMTFQRCAFLPSYRPSFRPSPLSFLCFFLYSSLPTFFLPSALSILHSRCSFLPCMPSFYSFFNPSLLFLPFIPSFLFPHFIPSFYSFLPSVLPSFLLFLPSFYSFRPSFRPSVRPSVLPSVRPSSYSFLVFFPSFLPSIPSFRLFLPSLLLSILLFLTFIPSFYSFPLFLQEPFLVFLLLFLPSVRLSFRPSFLVFYTFIPSFLPSIRLSFCPSFLLFLPCIPSLYSFLSSA